MTSTRLSVVIVACVLALSGCGSSAKADDSSSDTKASTPSKAPASDDQADALTAYVAAGQPKIPDLLKVFDGLYSDINIEAEPPGTVRYEYVYARQVDRQASLAALKKQAPTLKSSCATAVLPDMKRAGISSEPRVVYVFLNADKSKIWSYICKP